jgi:hypothetical protein
MDIYPVADGPHLHSLELQVSDHRRRSRPFDLGLGRDAFPVVFPFPFSFLLSSLGLLLQRFPFILCDMATRTGQLRISAPELRQA